MCPLLQVKKVTKTTTTRTVIPSVSDTMSLDGSNSVTGMGYGGPMYRQPGGPGDYPTATVPRNYHYGPPGGYDDYRGGPPSETYASLNRGMRMDPNYRLAECVCVMFLVFLCVRDAPGDSHKHFKPTICYSLHSLLPRH